MAITTSRRSIVRVSGAAGTSAQRASRPDDLAVEAPLMLVHDDVALATLMRTPGDDLELAAGWLVVESDVQRPDDIRRLRACSDEGLDRVHIHLREGIEPPRPRAYLTGSACGVCSADILDLTLRPGTQLHPPGWTVRTAVLAALPDAMRGHQRGFARTGGLHAAALAGADGTLGPVREDVGRHNAVDKVIGRALLDGELPASGRLLVVSGRVSFEIVQKAVAAGVAGIIAVSAPTSLAVDLARRCGLLLAAMVRDGRVNLYAGEDLTVEG